MSSPTGLRLKMVLTVGALGILSVSLYRTYTLSNFFVLGLLFVMLQLLSQSLVIEEIFEPKIVIVGLGVTGLCAARRLEELGYSNYVVLEQSSKAGGLASSVTDAQGFTWDLGVHVIFSHFEFFDALDDEVLPPSAWYEHTRVSPAFMRGRFVGYPVQDNLANFPADEAERIIANLRATRDDRQRCAEVTGKANFADWMHYCFGDELTASFGRPYNYKVWAYPAEELNSQWVGERVAVIDADDVEQRYRAGVERTNWGPNAVFRYPINGTGSVWSAVHKSLRADRLRLNAHVRHIDVEKREVLLANGGLSLHYDKLLSTMPIDKLASMVSLPEPLKEYVDKGFLHQSCHLVGYGLECPMPKELVVSV